MRVGEEEISRGFKGDTKERQKKRLGEILHRKQFRFNLVPITMARAGISSTSPSGQRTFRPKAKAPPSTASKLSSAFSLLNPARLFSRKRRQALPRSVYVNTPLPTGPEWRDKKGKIGKDKVYPTNQNVTSKYTVLTFLPKNLFEQFRRVANSE